MGIFSKVFESLKGPQDRSSGAVFGRPSMGPEEAYNKGFEAVHAERWDEALNYLRLATQTSPASARYWYALGLALEKVAPEGAGEDRLPVDMEEMASSFAKAIELSDKDGSLDPKQYHRSVATIGAMHRIEKRYDEAIRMFEKALEKLPDDQDMMEAIALCYFEKGDLNEAERQAEKLLSVNPNSEQGRKLWKQIRKQAGKSLAPDLPEEKRKEIYENYMSKKDNSFLLESNLLDAVQEAADLQDIRHTLDNVSQSSRQKAEELILTEYGVTPFQLNLILEEGKRKVWPFPSIMNLGVDKPRPQRDKFRDSLPCVHCGKRNVAPFWPENGDMVAYYNQSAETTREQPGKFRLPIECPFCRQTWFVVWDDIPDPISGQFIRHIERMCEAHTSRPQAAGAFRGLITNEILGSHVQFIKKHIEEAVMKERRMVEDSVTTDKYFSTITIVPASEPDEVRRYLGGSYFQYVEPTLSRADLNARHTVHWILAWGPETVGVHMTFLPKKSEVSQLVSILPTDLLTPQEKAQVGLA